MTALELVYPIEQFAPVALQEGWDNSGFCIGNPNNEVKKGLIALDCTEEVVDEAIELGCDIIITHHPLIFGGVKKISSQNFLGRIIEKAIKNNIIIYSAHTNLDKVENGVSGIMADKLNLINRETLTPDSFGIIGELEHSLPFEELAALIKRQFNLQNIRYSKPLEGEISMVAVCGGSGKSFIKNAMERNAQIYITGDITYHDFYCEKGFMLMDIGHYGSEYNIVNLLSGIVCENFPNFAVSISKKNNNPIYYY